MIEGLLSRLRRDSEMRRRRIGRWLWVVFWVGQWFVPFLEGFIYLEIELVRSAARRRVRADRFESAPIFSVPSCVPLTDMMCMCICLDGTVNLHGLQLKSHREQKSRQSKYTTHICNHKRVSVMSTHPHSTFAYAHNGRNRYPTKWT